MNNLFIEISNDGTVKNNNAEKGKKMSNFTGTLFELEDNINKRIGLFNEAIKSWNSEAFNLKRRDPETAYAYKILKFVEGQEVEEVVETTAGERVGQVSKFIAGASAEVNRLDYAKYLLRKEAATADPYDEYALVEDALVNTEKNYPSQSYQALHNSASLLRALTYEIRNVVLERKESPSYIKKRAGYLMRDARVLLEKLDAKEKDLKNAEFKLGYSLVRQ
jgi:hypothetical protein